MEQRIKEAIRKQKSALCLFMEDDRAFYSEYCCGLTDRIIREKRILEFENPNRVKVCYEYDIMASALAYGGENGDILFLFLPDKRKSWLKINCCGQRLTIPNSAKIRDVLYDVVKENVAELKKEVEFEGTENALWEEIWREKESIPCFVYAEPISGLLKNGGIVEIAFFDFLDVDSSKQMCHLRLFDEKYYEYYYPKVAKGNSWLYVKSPNKFDIAVSYDEGHVEKNAEQDPEISSFTIKEQGKQNNACFRIAVKVPRTLRMWYTALVMLGVVFLFCFAGAFVTAMIKGMEAKEFSPVYAQVGISIMAAIIATRGWLMNEETVLGRVSLWFTWIVILIVALLVGGYGWLMVWG